MPVLLRTFDELDIDQSGCLTKEEPCSTDQAKSPSSRGLDCIGLVDKSERALTSHVLSQQKQAKEVENVPVDILPAKLLEQISVAPWRVSAAART